MPLNRLSCFQIRNKEAIRTMANSRKRKPSAAKTKPAMKPVAKFVAKPGTAPLAAPLAAPTLAAKPQVAKPESVTAVADEAPVLRKKELIDRVVARSGVKKKDAKPTIEAMLAILGEALDKGEELNLHPMGKMKVTRVIEKPNAKVMVTKVRRRVVPADGTVVKITPET